MSFSARDIATDLVEAGVRPGGTGELRAMEAFASQDPAAILGRMTAAVMRAAVRDLGVMVTNPDAQVFNYRQADFITAHFMTGS